MTQILVVDDDQDIRYIVRLLLEDANYTVVEARDGVEALAHLRASTQPLVVLLDDLMPNADGLEVLRTVSEDHLLAAMHSFILMTGSSRMLSPSAAPRLNDVMMQMLPKPFDNEDLLEKVARARSRLLARVQSSASEDAL